MICSNSSKSVLTFIIIVLFTQANLFGQAPSHDPSHMVKDGGRYWIYTTGDGIWNMSSSNAEFTNWQAEPLVFPIGTWPGWINSYVSGFGGVFWAPEIIYMDSTWHLYYSCSTFGSQSSAIGVVTTKSLSSPNWTDQGMVVKSPGSWNVNAIDSDIFRDKEGKIWLLYGSYWDGIVITELDSATGKPINAENLTHIANNSCEAGNVIWHGDYYYLFFNRGSCCSGIHSTYHILTGRSSSPTGPFFDKDSVATHAGGGSLFLHSDDRYIGPGHFGYGENTLTYHYYDGAANGNAKLKTASLAWEDEWPVAVYEGGGAKEGTWVLKNSQSKKAMALANGDTVSGTNVVQYTETGDTSQHWVFTYMDGGYYKISPSLAPNLALEVPACNIASGANVQVGTYTGEECQQWYIAYMGSGVYRIMSRHAKKALAISSSSSMDDGANALQRSYSNSLQTLRWTLKVPQIIESVTSTSIDRNSLSVFPNPSKGNFNIDFKGVEAGHPFNIALYSLEGKLVYSKSNLFSAQIKLPDSIDKGVYIIKIDHGSQILTDKIIIQ